MSYDLDNFRRDWLGANTNGILSAYCSGGNYNRVETKRANSGPFAHVQCYEQDALLPARTMTRLAMTTDRRETAVTVTGMLGDSFSPLAMSITSEAEMIEALSALNTDEARQGRFAEFERIFDSFRLTEKALRE